MVDCVRGGEGWRGDEVDGEVWRGGEEGGGGDEDGLRLTRDRGPIRGFFLI